MVIAASVIVAIRTARMQNDFHAWHPDLTREIDQAVKLAKRIYDETHRQYVGLFK